MPTSAFRFRHFLWVLMLLAATSAHATFPGENGLLTFTRLESLAAAQVATAPAEEGADVTLATSVGTLNADSYWSPDGACIAYYSERHGGDPELYLMAADGSHETRLTVSPGYDYDGSFSPDGRSLVFVSQRDGDYEIFLYDLENGAVRQLTNNTAVDFTPAWSPDGSRIVFSSNRDGDHEIYIMGSEGQDQKRLTEEAGSDIYPSFSPDGETIVFATERAGTNGRDIWVMDTGGENQESRISMDGYDTDPAWSPDGKLIAFARDFDLYLVDASDGTSPVQVTKDGTGNDLGPDWQSIPVKSAESLCPQVTPKICGDANSDGDIKASDALAALRKSVGSPVTCPFIRCDTDDNESIVASDALRILRVSVGQVVDLDCPDVEP
jgi:dipeptidyl aminopeptidase/acylaminoacyl peptidase